MTDQQLQITVQETIPGVYVCYGPGTLSNSVVFVGRKSVLVADTMMTVGLARQVREAVRRVTDLPIRYVLNTHGDPDHVFGNQEFAGDAVLISHRQTRDQLAGAGDEPIRQAMERRPQLRADLAQVRIILPEVVFDDRLEIDLGGLVLECIYVGPAHTPGDVVIWARDQRLLFSADVVFNGLFPVMRNAHVNGWLGALDRLEGLSPETVVPGHGRAGGREILGTQWQLLTTIRDEVEAAMMRGLLAEDAEKQLKFPQYEGLPMAEERIPEAIRRLYATQIPALGAS